MDFKPKHIDIAMLGTNPLNNEALFAELLDVLESYPEFAPSFWSLQERGKLPYNSDDLINVVKGVTTNMTCQEIYLKRNKAPKYVGRIAVMPKQFINFEFDPKLNSKHYPTLFEFTDKLVKIFKPDIASMYIGPSNPVRPWETKPEVNIAEINEATFLAPVDYFKVGPKGLAMRTYFGPHYVKQFGQALLMSTPSTKTTLQPWGGVRLDLSETPWTLTEHKLVEHWQTAMTHLRSAKVFAEVEVYQNRMFKYKKAENCTIGGLNYV
ncbi:hypothetical protein I6F65_00405 [Pseudoalteromonas sp. SWXJZ94C]|uniref:hypothetical protein n=1 Tax=Pseudoalteromonas sp. SWXJZ94C TaxID=2792065 RepID=UPI0018CDB257|nr:hypothetical protein [Pseudoalteromonas sp. SWXJZ94C]MBH0055416.1 hypothetical protein [Pseudoalteromonas sp. SWXJZ94C]